MDFMARKIDGEIYVSIDQVNKAIEEKKRRNSGRWYSRTQAETGVVAGEG